MYANRIDIEIGGMGWRGLGLRLFRWRGDPPAGVWYAARSLYMGPVSFRLMRRLTAIAEPAEVRP